MKETAEAAESSDNAERADGEVPRRDTASLEDALGYRFRDRARLERALRHSSFRLLFVAFIINQTGFWISHLSLQAQMTQLTHNDTRLIGLLFFFLFVPAFLFAPLAGVAADRFDRKAIILCCYGLIASCCAVLAIATAIDAMTPYRMLAVAACMGLCFAFSGPASFALVPRAQILAPPEADAVLWGSDLDAPVVVMGFLKTLLLT